RLHDALPLYEHALGAHRDQGAMRTHQEMTGHRSWRGHLRDEGSTVGEILQDLLHRLGQLERMARRLPRDGRGDSSSCIRLFIESRSSPTAGVVEAVHELPRPQLDAQE